MQNWCSRTITTSVNAILLRSPQSHFDGCAVNWFPAPGSQHPLLNTPESDQSVSARFARVPPHTLVLLAILGVQLGAALSTRLFPVIGADGAVAMRLIFSALLFWLFFGPRLSPDWLRTVGKHWPLLLVFGLCMAAMNYYFYKAIEIIPLGVAVAIEFSGPLAVSALTSRKLSHLGWVALAATGIVLLTPFSGADLNPIGILYASLSGFAWAIFTLLARRVSDRLQGNDGLLIGMTVAALLMVPVLSTVSMENLFNPTVLLLGFSVGLFTAIPFMLEFEALKRLSSASYGILVSLEPAVAAMVGAVLLSERIGVRGLCAVVCVVVAAIGVSAADARDKKSPD